jgi:hypothetical protein
LKHPSFQVDTPSCLPNFNGYIQFNNNLQYFAIYLPRHFFKLLMSLIIRKLWMFQNSTHTYTTKINKININYTNITHLHTINLNTLSHIAKHVLNYILNYVYIKYNKNIKKKTQSIAF